VRQQVPALLSPGGRVWMNCYHAYGTRGLRGLQAVQGRPRNHKMMLGHYQQTKNLLVSYSPKALGFLSGR
jgi:aldehyde dehydrogenase